MAKIGRNDPCPCGSGKKHKTCCLKTGGPSVARVVADAQPTSATHRACDFCSDESVDELNDRADHILQELLESRVDVAEALCHEFIRDFPDDAEGFDLLSMVFEERGQPERALELLRQASSIAHANPDYDEETRLLIRQRIKEFEVRA